MVFGKEYGGSLYCMNSVLFFFLSPFSFSFSFASLMEFLSTGVYSKSSKKSHDAIVGDGEESFQSLWQ